jgi:predicted AlkP superfamily phosphohydrolase/phosphomutase
MSRSFLIVGLDGATLDLAEPWMEAGRLPNLAALCAGGTWGRLDSTLPAATFPAWTSFMTGANPGRHGIFDFTARVPGTYRVRFVNATFRRAPTLWRILSAAGRSVVSIGMPGTYPPEAVNGVMVSGFDAPVARTIDGSFVSPAAAYREVREVAGRLPFADVQEIDIGPDWAATAVPLLLDGIARKTALARRWLGERRWDCLSIVFGESDTVAHHCWRFHDPRSPRYVAGPYRDAVRTVYERLDRALGELVAAAPGGTTVLVVSDHGSGGAGDIAIHLNSYLRDRGLLTFTPRGVLGALAGVAKGAALRWCPPRLQEWVFRRAGWAADRMESATRFAGISWSRTMAFSEELDYAPTVWLNVQGRDPLGTVAPQDYERVRMRVCALLESWRDPWRGTPIVKRAYRREEVYDGPHVERAADIVLDLNLPDGYSYSCLSSAGGRQPAVRRLDPAEFAGGRGRGLNGTHRRSGLFVVAGGGVPAQGRIEHAAIADLAPTLLALAGVEVPGSMDGRVMAELLPPGTVVRRGRGEPGDLDGGGLERPYGESEEEDVAARLTALGYLDGPP